MTVHRPDGMLALAQRREPHSLEALTLAVKGIDFDGKRHCH